MSNTSERYTYDPENQVKECLSRQRDERIKSVYGSDFLDSLLTGRSIVDNRNKDSIIYDDIERLVGFINNEASRLEPEPAISINVTGCNGESLELKLYHTDIEFLCSCGAVDAKSLVKKFFTYKLNQYIEYIRSKELGANYIVFNVEQSINPDGDIVSYKINPVAVGPEARDFMDKATKLWSDRMSLVIARYQDDRANGTVKSQELAESMKAEMVNIYHNFKENEIIPREYSVIFAIETTNKEVM